MASAFVFLKDLQLGIRYLLRNPCNLLPRYEADPPRDRERRERDAWNDVAPILTCMIKEQSCGVLAGHAQGALDDPFFHILRTVSRHAVFDESAGGCFTVWTHPGISRFPQGG